MTEVEIGMLGLSAGAIVFAVWIIVEGIRRDRRSRELLNDARAFGDVGRSLRSVALDEARAKGKKRGGGAAELQSPTATSI